MAVPVACVHEKQGFGAVAVDSASALFWAEEYQPGSKLTVARALVHEADSHLRSAVDGLTTHPPVGRA